MNVADWLRSNSLIRVLLHGPTWAVPAGVGAYWIEQAAREWSPRALREQDGHLAISTSLQLIGPIPRDEKAWRVARMPAESGAACVERRPSRTSPNWSGGDLTSGLCRRFGGWWRYGARREWTDHRDIPAWPTVLSNVNLSPQELARLFGPDLSSSQLDEEPEYADNAWCYTMNSAQMRLDVTPVGVRDPWPLVQLQPWYDPTKGFTEYQLYPGDDRGDRSLQLVEDFARALAEATGGLLVDCDGFPWPARDGEQP